MRRLRLGDIARITHGYAFEGSGFTNEETGQILVTPGNFRVGGGFKLDKPKYFRGDVPERFVLGAGDLVVTMTDLSQGMDTLGSVAVIPELPEKMRFLHNQRVGKLELISRDVDPSWLAYRLRSHDYLAEIRASSSGSTVHHTSPSRIEQFEFELPPLTEQRGIAENLGAFDAKIESNRRIQAKAISLAEAVFKARTKTSVPKPLSSVATIVLGGTPSKSEPSYWGGNTIAWLNSGTANQEIVLEPTAFITEAGLRSSAAKLMPSGATILAITGATLGQVAYLGIEAAGNQSLIGAWGNTPALNAWIHFAIRDSVAQLLRSATGAAQQHVNKSNVEQLLIPMIPEDDINEWGKVAVPLLESAVAAASESQKLKSLRDYLLPSLISGSLRLPEPVLGLESQLLGET